jgi:signal peptidase II
MAVQKKWMLFFSVTMVVVGLDQWSKYWVLSDLTTAFGGATELGARMKIFASDAPVMEFDGYHYRPTAGKTLWEGVLNLKYAENPGAAFGLFRSLPAPLRVPFFHLISIGAVFLIAHYFRKLKGAPQERWALWGLPLVLGGAIGNYLDRLARGFVVDFIDAHWQHYHWPSFNIADSAICIGVGLLVIDSYVRKEVPVQKDKKMVAEPIS